ncbi:3-dehydroquinate synthase [Salinibacillus xinjiangensis]|uniref:3-dehydroquinate synthase n=1 Tax=Salinibacillus xinjiangensis TaxID=1229268 RepID=A0A6G1X5X3_9BACI|nr:3-dehydroquinate synthase [Salinibacillus xinjiangensis]MRG86401.1 3-dehydroquinate synthase [Salinibacillus xinjiangensis]
MQTLKVSSSQGEYNVYIGKGIRFKIDQLLPKSYEKILVITDDTIERLGYLQDICEPLHQSGANIYSYTVPSGEQSKSIQQYEQLLTYAIEKALDRHSLIIAIGGGVVGDLAGFVAATFMRGIDYIQVPTTILAHDSSVGGKVAINHPLGKNLIGSFHAPKGVIYDLETLDSLSLVEKRSGFAEVIKHALIRDEELLELLMNQVDSLENIDYDILHQAIYKGIEIKANIVAEDEREKGIRSYLNYGHTLGHAIETEAGYGKITHGEAIAIGMLFALRLSEKSYQIDLPIARIQQWFIRLQYPLKEIGSLQVDSLVERMKNDKKNKQGKIRMVLLEDVASPQLVTIQEDVLAAELSIFINEVIGNDKGN